MGESFPSSRSSFSLEFPRPERRKGSAAKEEEGGQIVHSPRPPEDEISVSRGTQIGKSIYWQRPSTEDVRCRIEWEQDREGRVSIVEQGRLH